MNQTKSQKSAREILDFIAEVNAKGLNMVEC